MGATKTECSECLAVFNGVKPFDKHRIGKHGVNRRCMTAPEMIAAGLVKGQWNRWSLP